MKFSVSSSALLSLLATTGKVISNKNTLPILDYFLLELTGNELKVTTSDLETTLTGTLHVDNVESEGTIAAPAKLMLDSLKEFAEMPLTIEVNDQNWEIRLSWKSGSLSIPGASAVSYPVIQTLSPDCKELSLDVDTLVNGINKTIFATADDELRPVMNGVFFNLEPGKLTFVGTDAHKLVRYEMLLDNEITASFILPKKPANLLKTVLLKEEEAIQVSFDSKNAVFRLKSHTLVCRLIEGVYPNYNAVIPANNPNKVLVDRIELLNGIKRVAVCEPDNQPDPYGYRRESDQSDGTGYRLLRFCQRDDQLQLRRTANYNRLQIDLPGRNPFEYGDPDGDDRIGRLDPCRRIQSGI